MSRSNDAPPIEWKCSVTYEIFVQSFADSNGDGIGDLNGVTSKLDYLADLGVEAIWLMPINPSPSYHKYDVTDYYGIHPDYGTMEDFKRLLAEAHRRNIKIAMDLVINHCSRLHPWFTSALNPESKYRNYFIWSTPEEVEAEGNLLKEVTGDSDNIHQWNEVRGQDKLYFSFFWSGMPDLNYDNQKLREEIYRIGEFWLKDVGVDGFRLDAAKHIYPDHRAEDNHAFWKKFKTKMEAIKPDVYLIGEVWADLPTQAPFAQGFTALFNFDLGFSIMETVKNNKVVSANIHQNAWKVNEKGSPVTLFNESEESFKKLNPDFINATFLTNHDQNRVMSFLKNSTRKAKLAASILLTFPGAPYIYYGEELGMRGRKPDEQIREPFPWSAEYTPEQTTWMEVTYNTPKNTHPLDEQMQTDTSIYHHYRALIRFRRSSGVMAKGCMEPAATQDDEVLGYYRILDDQTLLVLHNLSAKKKQIKLSHPYTQVEWSSSSQQKSLEDTLVLRPYGSIILSKPKS